MMHGSPVYLFCSEAGQSNMAMNQSRERNWLQPRMGNRLWFDAAHS